MFSPSGLPSPLPPTTNTGFVGQGVWFPTMTSADLCRPCFGTRSYPRLRPSQISPGKNNNLLPMYPPHLPPCAPGSGRASFCLANSPALHGLICGFCSSGRDFAASFLQIPTHVGHPCFWLTLLAAKRVADLNRRVVAHAGRTKKLPGQHEWLLRHFSYDNEERHARRGIHHLSFNIHH